MTKRILIMIVMIALVGVGCALTLKAAVGVGAIDALNSTMGSIFGIHIGTIGMATNFACIFIQMFILQKNSEKYSYFNFL
ncbi:MAG: hypothetical protein ACK5LC_14680 [Coprobacillaceae bacterium]